MKTAPSKRTKKVNATRYNHLDYYAAQMLHCEFANKSIAVIPDDAESYDAMVEQMARGMYINVRRYESQPMTWETTWQQVRDGYLKDAQATLAAIGITRPKQRRAGRIAAIDDSITHPRQSGKGNGERGRG